MPNNLPAEPTSRERACFYCTNFHQLEPNGECDCSCHGLWPTLDKLDAINKDVRWNVPQLVTIQKLLDAAKLEALEKAAQRIEVGPKVYRVHMRCLNCGHVAQKEFPVSKEIPRKVKCPQCECCQMVKMG